VEFLVKIVGFAVVLQSIFEVAPLTTISHGIQCANSTTETTEPEVPHLEQAVAMGPLIASK
jgi:hypothetical protein